MRALDRQMIMVAGLQRAQMMNMLTPSQMAQLCLNDKEAENGQYLDLYANSDCVEDSEWNDQSPV